MSEPLREAMKALERAEAIVRDLLADGSASSDSDRQANDVAAIAYEQGREDERANIGKTWVYYRCSRCGKVSPPYQREPGDDAPPKIECRCFIGAKWERVIVGQSLPQTEVPTETDGGNVELTSNQGGDGGRGRTEEARPDKDHAHDGRVPVREERPGRADEQRLPGGRGSGDPSAGRPAQRSGRLQELGARTDEGGGVAGREWRSSTTDPSSVGSSTVAPAKDGPEAELGVAPSGPSESGREATTSEVPGTTGLVSAIAAILGERKTLNASGVEAIRKVLGAAGVQSDAPSASTLTRPDTSLSSADVFVSVQSDLREYADLAEPTGPECDPPRAAEDQSPAVWFCKIGEVEREALPNGADLPLRLAVERAYRELTGHGPTFCFSGWNGTLTEPERAVVEDREPHRPADGPSADAYTQNIVTAARAMVAHKKLTWDSWEYECANCNMGQCDVFGALWRDLREAVADHAQATAVTSNSVSRENT